MRSVYAGLVAFAAILTLSRSNIVTDGHETDKSSVVDDLIHRLHLLGLDCEDVALNRADSAVQALSCFPMYMVANVHAFTDDRQWKVPAFDIPGFEALREAHAIGRQESALAISKQHSRVLATLLAHAKPSDLAIYECALQTLELFFSAADAAVVEEMRTSIARMIVAVAEASGKGFFGTGEKVSEQELYVIQQIDSRLGLRQSEGAREILAKFD